MDRLDVIEAKLDLIIEYLEKAEKCRWNKEEYSYKCSYSSICDCKRCIGYRKRDICAGCGDRFIAKRNHDDCWDVSNK